MEPTESYDRKFLRVKRFIAVLLSNSNAIKKYEIYS